MTTFELQPHLVGDLIELRPLTQSDWDELFAVASDPLIWEQHPANDRYKENVFREFFSAAIESGGAFVVIDRDTQRIIGSSRYYDYKPYKSEIEIGWTFLARTRWGGKFNSELKQLMLEHAFQFVDTVVFIVGAGNLRSQKAVEKIGGVLRDRRKKTDPDGKSVEDFVYALKKPAAPAPLNVNDQAKSNPLR